LFFPLNKVNALAQSLVVNRAVENDMFDHVDARAPADASCAGGAATGGAETLRDALEAEWTFSPEKGNVVFASAIDGWAFGIADFARMWAPRIPNCRPKLLREYLWGDFA